MAKDDYFVLIYKILAYLYQALKSGENPDFEYLCYDTKAFPICESYWNYIFEMLLRDEYISGIVLANRLDCTGPTEKP